MINRDDMVQNTSASPRISEKLDNMSRTRNDSSGTSHAEGMRASAR